MPKTLIKVARENKNGVYRSFVLIDERVLPFENSDEINVYVEADLSHGVTVYSEGPRGASTTAKLEKAGGKIIEPLTATVNNDFGVGHASDEFTVTSA